MTVFQIGLLGALGALLVGRIIAIYRRRGPRGVAGFWAAIWLGGAVAVAAPELTTELASRLGIRRGADFVSYVAVFVMFLGFYMGYMRLRRLDRNLTLLVRRLALAGAQRPPADQDKNGNRMEILT